MPDWWLYKHFKAGQTIASTPTGELMGLEAKWRYSLADALLRAGGACGAEEKERKPGPYDDPDVFRAMRALEEYAAKTTASPEAALESLKDIGILDEDGNPSERFYGDHDD